VRVSGVLIGRGKRNSIQKGSTKEKKHSMRREICWEPTFKAISRVGKGIDREQIIREKSQDE
jgi:hypothetical protein